MAAPPGGSGPKSFLAQQFHAHQEGINCSCIGRMSHRVIATGSQDKTVNVFRVGHDDPLMTLTGHTTEVDCVEFDLKEEQLAGGSRGGTVKIWTLEKGKTLRTFTGHRSSVSCIEFHPFGMFFASGSVDTNIKVWDISKKGCMQTYRGHKDPITKVKHSPDGRWVVSGDSAGRVKVWDLTAGKQLAELRMPGKKKGAVTSLDFHPNEFVLAVSAAGARSTCFFDMENFTLLSASTNEPSLISRVMFSDRDEAVLTACTDYLKVISWDPVGVFDVVETGWGDVDDMTITENGVALGISHQYNVMSVVAVELESLHPFCDPPQDDPDDEEYLAKGSPIQLANQSPSEPGPLSGLMDSSSALNSAAATAAKFAPKVMPFESVSPRYHKQSADVTPHPSLSNRRKPGNERSTYSQSPSRVDIGGDKLSAALRRPPPVSGPKVPPSSSASSSSSSSSAAAASSASAAVVGGVKTTKYEWIRGGRTGGGGSAQPARGAGGQHTASTTSAPPPSQYAPAVPIPSDNRPAPRTHDEARRMAGSVGLVQRSPTNQHKQPARAPPSNPITQQPVAAGKPSSSSAGGGKGHVGSSVGATIAPFATGGVFSASHNSPQRSASSSPAKRAPSPQVRHRIGPPASLSHHSSTPKKTTPAVVPPRVQSPPNANSSSSSSSSSNHTQSFVTVRESRPDPERFAPSPVSQRASAGPASSSAPALISPDDSSGPIGLSVTQFLPGAKKPTSSATPEQIRAQLLRDNPTMVTLLTQRIHNMGILARFWQAGQVGLAVAHLTKIHDPPCAVDFLTSAEEQFKRGVLTLDLCRSLMPLVNDLLNSEYESHALCGLRYIQIILKSFGRLIKDTRALPLSRATIGHEERLEKCNAVYEYLLMAQEHVIRLSKSGSGARIKAKTVTNLLKEILGQ